MAPSSARVSAPHNTSKPEKIQTAITGPDSGMRRAIRLGTTKIPEPITAPTNSRAVSRRLSLRGSSAGGLSGIGGPALDHQPVLSFLHHLAALVDYLETEHYYATVGLGARSPLFLHPKPHVDRVAEENGA